MDSQMFCRSDQSADRRHPLTLNPLPLLPAQQADKTVLQTEPSLHRYRVRIVKTRFGRLNGAAAMLDRVKVGTRARILGGDYTPGKAWSVAPAGIS